MARYAVKNASRRKRRVRQECATACPLRARSALCRELLKIAVWDIEDTASERTPMQWHDNPTVFQEKILNGVECHARDGLFVPLHARFGHAVLFAANY